LVDRKARRAPERVQQGRSCFIIIAIIVIIGAAAGAF
jgi:hypothetical protein